MKYLICSTNANSHSLTHFSANLSKYHQKDVDVEALFYKACSISPWNYGNLVIVIIMIIIANRWKKICAMRPPLKDHFGFDFMPFEAEKKYFANTLIDVARWWFGTKLVLFNFFESLKPRELFQEGLFQLPGITKMHWADFLGTFIQVTIACEPADSL